MGLSPEFPASSGDSGLTLVLEPDVPDVSDEASAYGLAQLINWGELPFGFKIVEE